MFRAPADKWQRNAGPVKANRALIESPDGQTHPGIRVKQETSNVWLVMTEAHAVDMATQVLAAIDARCAHEQEK